MLYPEKYCKAILLHSDLFLQKPFVSVLLKNSRLIPGVGAYTLAEVLEIMYHAYGIPLDRVLSTNLVFVDWLGVFLGVLCYQK